MPDRLGEWLEAQRRFAQRQMDARQELEGFDLPSGVLAGTNPDAGGETTTELSAATGYDGTNTVMPFMRGISNWDEDLWTG